MSTIGKVLWVIFTILIFFIGIWPLGIISIIVGILQLKRAKKEAAKKEKEIEVYKTAAEVEHSLNRERDRENEIYYR